MKNWMIKFGGMIASLALVITAFNANNACMLFVHQPELPSNAKKLRKF